MAINSAIKCEPPEEKKGKGIPANGNIPIADDILINDWETIQKIIPITTNLENLSVAFLDIFNPNQKNKIKITTNIIHPKAPISSPIMANIESVIDSGKNPNFCVDIPSPFPKIPPDPSDIKDCLNCNPLPSGSA